MTRMRAILCLSCGVWICVSVASTAQVPGGDEEPDPNHGVPPLRSGPEFNSIFEGMRRNDTWPEYHRLIMEATDSVWERNGWDDEADLFAHDTIWEVSRIPPWKLQKRMNALFTRLRRRYSLTPRQEIQFRRLFFVETMRFSFKHYSTILEQSRELIETRANGLPFMPDQIARMAPELREELIDGRAAIERIMTRGGESFTDEQREILQRDLASLHRRIDHFEQLTDKWERGEWEPSDWGLDRDPIHGGTPMLEPDVLADAVTSQPASQPTGPATAQPVIATVRPDDERTWAAYVRQFVRRYRLDPDQRNSAWSIHTELVARAGSYRRKSDIPWPQRSASATTQPTTQPSSEPPRVSRELRLIVRAYDELVRRLGLLPTTRQRRMTASGRETPALIPVRTTRPAGDR